jgi:signal peptidase I
MALGAEPRAERRVSDAGERPEGGEQPSPPDPPVAQPAWSTPYPAELPGDEHGWVTPPAAVDGHAADGSWPSQEPAPASPGGEAPAGGLAAPVAAEPRLHDDHPPHGQSRNPVDRLTRNLPHGMRVTIDWIVTIVGAIAIVLLVKAFVVNPYRIPSSSMEPTLHCARPEIGCEARYSDRVLANRFLYHLRDPRRGEIIVFKTPPEARLKCGAGGTFVKRLIGLPGDTVELRLKNGDGYVFINGKPLKEPYIQQSRRAAVQAYGPVKVKPGNYFMMGDNRSQSCDSRMWGTVPRANLIGKVFATYWPPNRVSLH